MKSFCTLALIIAVFTLVTSPALAEKPLTFSSGAGAMSIVVDVAIDKGFIDGRKAQMLVFKNGAETLDAFLKGQVDIGTASPNNVILSNEFDPQKHAIVGMLSYTDSQLKLLTRNASDITRISDLRGKKIATTGSFGHFSLCKLLAHNGISPAEVTILMMKKKQMPAAIATGKIDAIFQHGAPIEASKKLLGDNAWLIFQNANIARKLLILIMNRDMINNNPKLTDNVLKAIFKAQDYLKANHTECVAIGAKSKKYTLANMEEAMSEITFDLMLRQSLLLSMETMETWAIDNGFVKRSQPRNYLDYIDPPPLERVAPNTVTIIH
ncbi:ABC transporter substrate-binding protein [uncultured Pseudodesulfovibrio sp.]|uniref:ABC transporter substrate-binding protein n=1 Tax=uncultured Pseudodesulfovibrio sp. TaxID=2035858 RepID=UPI0029C8D5A9|nr:ABC transporter substrate-binding protein [uncultured Pseudodesulfovibrio sp.]